jgi:hypothetical protein
MSIILFQCLLDFLHPFAQPFQGFFQPGQALYVGIIFDPLFVWDCRDAKNVQAGLDRIVNAGFRADFHHVSNLKVARYPDLPSHGYMVSNPGAARNTDLADKQAVLAYHDIVSNHDEIIDFGSALYPRPAKSGPIDRGICADLNVIVKLHYAGLGDFHMPSTLVLGIAVTISADNRAGMDNDPVPQDTPVKYASPRMYQTSGTDPYIFAYVGPGSYTGPGPYPGMLSNVRVRTDRNTFPEHHTLADKSGFMDSGLTPGVSEEQLGQLSSGQVRVLHNEQIEFEFPEFGRNDQTGRFAPGDQVTVARTY